MKSTTRRAWIVFAVFVITFLLVLAYKGTAGAHEWYDAVCCSDRDCHAAAAGAVRPVSTGYLITRTGEVIPYSKARVSPDGEYHTCENPAGKTLCLYAPPMGF